MNTIKEAKDYLDQHKNKGTHCPACDQFVKVYKRSLYGTVVERLVSLYELSGKKADGDFFHVTKIYESLKTYITGDFYLASRFGLIEEKPVGADTSKKNSGYWRITAKGIAFLKGEITVPKYVLIQNGETKGFTGKEVTAADVAGKGFNYQELMNR